MEIIIRIRSCAVILTNMHACVYLCMLWIQPNNSRYTDEFHVVQVVLMLPSPFHTVVDEIGHTLKDLASLLQLDTN